MAKKEIEVILTEPVVSLNANEGDQVKVAPGYARNFLLPQGKAVPASIANQRYLEALKARRSCFRSARRLRAGCGHGWSR